MKKIMFVVCIVVLCYLNGYTAQNGRMWSNQDGGQPPQVQNQGQEYEEPDCPNCPYDAGMPTSSKKLVDEAKRRTPHAKIVYVNSRVEPQQYKTLVMAGFYNNTNKDIVAFEFTCDMTDSFNRPVYFMQGGRRTSTFRLLMQNANFPAKCTLVLDADLYGDNHLSTQARNFRIHLIRFADGTVWGR